MEMWGNYYQGFSVILVQSECITDDVKKDYGDFTPRAVKQVHSGSCCLSST